MNTNIKKTIDEFLLAFKNHKVVKKYLILKEKLLEDQEFVKLKNQKKNAQKNLALSINKENYNKAKQEFLKAKEEYENYPLYINYLEYYEEVKVLLKEIELYLK